MNLHDAILVPEYDHATLSFRRSQSKSNFHRNAERAEGKLLVHIEQYLANNLVIPVSPTHFVEILFDWPSTVYRELGHSLREGAYPYRILDHILKLIIQSLESLVPARVCWRWLMRSI